MSSIPEKHIIFLLVPMLAVEERARVGLEAIFFSTIGGRVIAVGAILSKVVSNVLDVAGMCLAYFCGS